MKIGRFSKPSGVADSDGCTFSNWAIGLSAPLVPVTCVCLQPGPGTPETSALKCGSDLVAWKEPGPAFEISMMSDSLLCDFGQVRSPLWASLFSYSLPCLHHQRHLETCGGEKLGVHLNTIQYPLVPRPRGQLLKPSTMLFFAHALPPSWTPFLTYSS